VVHVIASLFVGVDIDREGRTWSLISLCTPAGIYDFLRDEITAGASKTDRINKAQENAQRIYREEWDNLRLIGDRIFFDPHSPYAKIEEGKLKPGMFLKDAIGAVNEIYEKEIYNSRKYPAIVTLTVSYFGGEKDKEAADNIGIKGVNMEDYHVLRVIRSALCQGISKTSDYPIILGGRVDRIQCDPREIEKDVLDAFDKYAKEANPRNQPHALLTAEDYADVIIWGLKGLLTTEMPACVRWNFIDHYWEEGDEWVELIKKHFWSFAYNEKIQRSEFIVPNPFCIEIATDFLSELTEMKPGIAEVTNEEIKKKVMNLALAVKDAWNMDERRGARAQSGPARQGAPPEVREKEYIGPAGPNTRSKAIDLMYYIAQNCRFAVIWDDKFLLKNGRMLKPEDIAPQEKGRIFLKTWLRPGKWGSAASPVKAPTTQDLTDPDFSNPKFDSECVDRAFYKSCNMMALQTMAWSVFRE
jgi:hypothetical protein